MSSRDVLVFGAGPAGIAAAVAAAREGCSVRLVELQNVIGGVISSCPGMMLGSGYPCGVSVGGFFEELVQRLEAYDPPAAERRPCDLANFGDEVVYDYDVMIAELHELLAGAGVELLLNHLPADVAVDDGRVRHIDVVSPCGQRAASRPACTSTAPATATSPRGPGCRASRATRAAGRWAPP